LIVRALYRSVYVDCVTRSVAVVDNARTSLVAVGCRQFQPRRNRCWPVPLFWAGPTPPRTRQIPSTCSAVWRRYSLGALGHPSKRSESNTQTASFL